ncbi:MAG TPA: LysR family transcriptional regulator [Candidatus Acidoferrales bacterium]|nr:LysR family transcriptional regulator [Candidatus Acidoferrales bacterium]
MAVNLSSIDLNLFLVLHAVLEERSATRAAARLNVTQSAVSNAIARLRRLLGDPLLVRAGRGLVPTPRAQELEPLLREATERLALALDRRGFVPAETTRTFTIALSDNYQACDAPRIARAFAERMPRATLRVVSTDYLAATDGLASGEIDLTFAPEQSVQPGMRSAVLFEERAALIVRRDHPRVRTQMTRKLFNDLPHIDVHVVLGRPGMGHRVAQRGWERAHVRRRVLLTVPYFIIAAMAAAETDCVAALPGRMADLCVRLLPLKRVRAMFPLPRVNTVMLWHERTNSDPGARVFRDIVFDVTRQR